MSKISVVVNTKNEEKNLPRALASVKDLADEIVVVDMFSTDNTVAIAKKAGAKVYTHRTTGYVEPARNFAISRASGDWILILDADERISDSLAQKLKEISKDREAVNFYRLPRKNIIFGKWVEHARWWPDYNIRFFRKGAVRWSEIIHSVPETHGIGVDLPPEESLAIIHYHYDSIEQYVQRMNFYTTKHAELLIKDGYKFFWRDLIKKPTNEFLSRYFFGQGYKDGVHGLALSLLQAFSELILYLKVWQAEKFKDEKPDVREAVKSMRDAETDVHYWQADTLLREGGGIMESLKQRAKRKFKI